MAKFSYVGRRKLLRCLVGLATLPGAAVAQNSYSDISGPSEAKAGTVLVRFSSLSKVLPGRRLLARVRIPETSAPVLGAESNTSGHRLLWKLVFEGKAAGNSGDLYENRDREHSLLPPDAHPQLTRILFDNEIRAAGFDYGLAGPLIFDRPVIGNSSTAVKQGPLWRSLPRLALGHHENVLTLYQNYLAGQVHVYPEHRDHDPEYGDLFPANTPFYIISQGSSGSDQPHLEALAMILAALRPETKAFLHENQLLAPTVQLIFRRSLAAVSSVEGYRSGQAHPSVIPRDQINLLRMVGFANSLTPETVPPMVRLSVLSETIAIQGVDYFGEDLTERLIDTPVAIGRVWRSHAFRRSMIVSVESTRDLNGRPPEFTWRILRGDPARTRVEPLDDRGLRARITVDWQLPRPVPGSPDIRSSRVDVGVFANSGHSDSMPGLISILLPQHETRRYEAGPDGEMRIQSIDRRVEQDAYADPVLFPRCDWRDVYQYSAEGVLQGWERRGEGQSMRFDALGRQLTPAGAVPMRYPVERPQDAVHHVVMRAVPQGGAD